MVCLRLRFLPGMPACVPLWPRPQTRTTTRSVTLGCRCRSRAPSLSNCASIAVVPTMGSPSPSQRPRGQAGGWQVILWHRSRLVVSGPGVSSREFQLEWSAPTHLPSSRGLVGARGRVSRSGQADLALVALGMGTALLSWSYQSQSRAVGPPGWFSSQISSPSPPASACPWGRSR